MNCPKCESPDNKTIDSRPASDTIRRRRKCDACEHRWTTYEVPDEWLHASSRDSDVLVRFLDEHSKIRKHKPPPVVQLRSMRNPIVRRGEVSGGVEISCDLPEEWT